VAIAIDATTVEGKKLASGTSATITVPIGGALQPVTVRVTGLNRIDLLLSVRLFLNPVVTATPSKPKVGTTPGDTNVSGLTVYCEAGTTLRVEATALGV